MIKINTTFVQLPKHKQTWCPIINILSCLSSSMITGSSRTTTSRYDSPPADSKVLMWCGGPSPVITITSVPIVEFILVTVCKILRIGLLYHPHLNRNPAEVKNLNTYFDFLICHPIAHASVQFIQGFPRQLIVWEKLPGLYRSLKR